MTVSAVAEARMTDQRVKRYRCALCVVDDSFDSDDDDDDNRNRNRNDNLTVDDGYVAVAGGDVRINGDLRLDRGTVSVNGGRARMTGRVTPSNRSSQVSPRAIEFERSSFGDPFDSSTFPMPSSSGPRKDEPCTDGPGVYEDRYTLDDDEICILPPGRYVIEDRWRIRDDARLTGSGVLLYFRDRGRLQIRDDAQVQLSALPTTVVVDRGNSQDLRVEDDAVLRVTGTIYAPRSDLLVYDDARAYLDSLVVVGDMHVEDGAVEVDYVRSLNHPFPEPMERLPGLQN
jgi:hypothetical protein